MAAGRRSAPATRSAARTAGALGTGAGDLAVPRGRHDRGKWGISRRGDGGVRAGQPRAGGGGRGRGAFAGEIVPCGEVAADECPRPDTSLAKMAALAPLRDGGLVTAALASQIADAAAALLIASGRAVRAHGLRPLARIRHPSARGDDPVMMLTAPIPATAHALRRAGMTLGQLDLIEINEAFAPVVLAWQRETGADLARVNVSGGAIALGHPLGATGARLLTTLAHCAGPDRRPVRDGDHARGRQAQAERRPIIERAVSRRAQDGQPLLGLGHDAVDQLRARRQVLDQPGHLAGRHEARLGPAVHHRRPQQHRGVRRHQRPGPRSARCRGASRGPARISSGQVSPDVRRNAAALRADRSRPRPASAVQRAPPAACAAAGAGRRRPGW